MPALAGEVLSLPQAVDRALTQNPAMRAGDYTIVAAERQADIAGLAPPWVVGADIENVGGTGSVAGVHAAETTLRLGRVIERGGKRDARRAAGAIDIERSRNALEQTRLELATEATRRFVEVLADQVRSRVAIQEAALARERDAGGFVGRHRAGFRHRGGRPVRAAGGACLCRAECAAG
ncbi:MAG TPA: TolC family protein [Rhodanobacter sp.]|nr:TolC family protein [Rhodanobacter sp.]